MAQLSEDQGFRDAAAARDTELEAQQATWRDAEKPIIEDLREAGVEVASVWDLVNTAEPYPLALPVLMRHLDHGDYPPRVLEGVARALAVGPSGVYWQRLRDLYVGATERDVTEGLAVALAASAGTEDLEGLLVLIGDESRGSTRVHFVRPILKLGGARGREVVEGLRDDPVLGREATAMLP